jgi:hypothetical protein
VREKSRETIQVQAQGFRRYQGVQVAEDYYSHSKSGERKI